MVLGCDGIWERLSNEEMVQHIIEAGDEILQQRREPAEIYLESGSGTDGDDEGSKSKSNSKSKAKSKSIEKLPAKALKSKKEKKEPKGIMDDSDDEDAEDDGNTRPDFNARPKPVK